MEMKKITEKVYYIPSHTNIGVIKSGSNATLIDTGLDDDMGKKILKVLGENQLQVKSIINSHSHADHCGGNKFVKERSGASVYASELESALIQTPFIEPLYIFSGASPIIELQNKFLMAQPSNVDYVIKKDERKIKIDGIDLGIVPLPGHSPNQIGIEADNVLFCADSVFSKEVLEKHKIPFFTDIEKTIDTLNFLRNSNYSFYVPSHAEPAENLRELASSNLECISSIENYIMDDLDTMKSTEHVLKDLCDHYKIDIKSTQQYYLLNTSNMAYLSFLNKRGKIKTEVKENKLYWEKV